MAIIWKGMRCPLCNETIDLDARDYIALPYVGLFGLIEGLPYAALDDAAIHRACLSNWGKRDHFIGLFNKQLRDSRRLSLKLIVNEGQVSWSDDDPHQSAPISD